MGDSASIYIRKARSAWLGLVIVAAAFGCSPAAAAADTFFAAPGGSGMDCTTPATACELQFTVETKAAFTDEVVVLPGNYVLDDELTIDTTLHVHGLVGQPPRIFISSITGTGLAVTTFAPNTRLADLVISSDGSGPALDLSGGQSTIAERLHVTGEGIACQPSFSLDPSSAPAILRDSVCLNAGSGDAVGLAIGIPSAIHIRLVNVTAVATSGSGDGIHLGAASGCNCLINATNVIAAGNEAGGGTDVRATTTASGDTATVALDHSNYSSESESGGGVENVTNPGLGTNQTAAPSFEPGADNFHQAAGSPTIDMGATNPLNGGTLDFDGEARAQGLSQDIGADEFTVVPPTPPSAPPAAAGPSLPVVPRGIATLLSAIAKGKKLVLTLACSGGGGNCSGNVLLKTAKPVKSLKAATAKRKGKMIVLGSGSFSIAAGQTQTVPVPLTKRGRKLFGSRGKVGAKATITAEGTSTLSKLGIKRKGKKKKKRR
jgi:hypothetical protein